MLGARGAVRLRAQSEAARNSSLAACRLVARRQVSTEAQPLITPATNFVSRTFTKLPKGFENFYPNAGKAPKAAPKGGDKGSASSTTKNVKAEFKLGGGSGGGGGKNGLPAGMTEANAIWLGLGTLGLMSLVGSMGESHREINWIEFKYQLLGEKKVDRLEVVNGTRVNVYLNMSNSLGLGMGGGVTPPANGQSISPYYFTIGSTESFERKLQEANAEFEIPPRESVPVQYKTQTSPMSIALSFAPTLLLIGAFVFMA